MRRGEFGPECIWEKRITKTVPKQSAAHGFIAAETSLQWGEGGFIKNTCALTREKLKCWPQDYQIKAGEPKLQFEASCGTEHPVVTGPAACTSCPTSGETQSFTIFDPKTNTGTCTATECPLCKPRACCRPHHKHLVVNTKSLTGVCVWHTDDCTPMCMPRGDLEQSGGRRVCSKGCNQMLKVDKDFSTTPRPDTKDESKLFDMVVCQADKRVLCDSNMATAASTFKAKSTCEEEKSIKSVGRCAFNITLWNLGGSCLSSHVNNLPHKVCPDSVSDALVASIHTLCHNTTATQDGHLCTPLAISF